MKIRFTIKGLSPIVMSTSFRGAVTIGAILMNEDSCKDFFVVMKTFELDSSVREDWYAVWWRCPEGLQMVLNPPEYVGRLRDEMVETLYANHPYSREWISKQGPDS